MITIRMACLSVLLSATVSVTAQDVTTWEQTMQDELPAEDEEAGGWEDLYDLLCELEQHPIDLNSATREDLEQLPFLTERQVCDIVEYLYRYGPMKSKNELRMVESLDDERVRLLWRVVRIGEQQGDSIPRLADVVRYGHHELMGSVRVPFYERRGDENGYLGYKYKHWLRYQFTYDDYVKAGLVGAQDAGEPFFASKNSLGYDFYSLYVQVKHLGRLENAVVGKYRLSTGMGLVLNNSFGLGKLSLLQNMGRSANTLRAHSSRSSSDYMQGAAATVNTGRGTQTTLFVSYRPMDATLNADGTAATLLKDGYHRTPTEMAKKSNTYATAAGAHLNYRYGRFRVGATAVYTHLNRELRPKSALYRQHYAAGTDFLNLSVDYGYASRRLSVSGETATDRHGALATINTMSVLLADELSMMAVQRFYSYRFTSLYANSFREGSQVQNESGIYVGADWRPSSRLRLQAYTDYAYFPWARYQVSQSSHSWDNMLSAVYTRSSWSLAARYRLHLRQRDAASSTDITQTSNSTTLTDRYEHRGRLSLTIHPAPSLTTVTQGDIVSVFGGFAVETGYMVSENVGWQHGPLRLNLLAAYFDTDSYDSRLYVYERGPLYAYSFPSFSGQGIRYALMARLDLTRQLMLTAKVGITDYFDRAVIGTSYQQINASSQTDLDLQFRWKF